MKRVDRNGLASWVAEVSAKLRRNIYDNGDYLSVGWHSVRVRTFYSFKKCGKCCAFGHTTKECKNSQCCAKCSGEHHRKDCDRNDNDVLCINCVKYNRSCKDRQHHVNSHHPSWWFNCPCNIYQCDLSEAREEPW